MRRARADRTRRARPRPAARRRCAAPAAGACGAPVAASAAAKAPKPALVVVTKTRARLRRGSMRVRIAYPAAGRVRVTARFRRAGPARGWRASHASGACASGGPGAGPLRLRITRGGPLGAAQARLLRCKVGVVVARHTAGGPLRSRRGAPGLPARSRARGTVLQAARVGPGPVARRARSGPARRRPTSRRRSARRCSPTPRARASPTREDGFQIIGDPDENLYAKSFVPSEGIHTRVRARALVIEQRGRKFALVQTDLGGLPVRAHPGGAPAGRRPRHHRRAADALRHPHALLDRARSGRPTPPATPRWAATLFDPRVFELTVAGDRGGDPRRATRDLEPARARDRGRASCAAPRATAPSTPSGATPRCPTAEADARRRLDRPRPDRDPRRRRRRPADRRLVELRHPPDLVRRREPALLGRQRGHRRARGRARRSRRGRGRGHAPAADRPPVNVWTNSQRGRHLARRRARPGRRRPAPVRAELASPRPTWRDAASGEGVLGAWRDGRQLDAATRWRSTPAARSSPSTAPQADGEPVGPLAVLGAGGIAWRDDGVCAPSRQLRRRRAGQKFPAIAGTGLVPSVSPVSVWRVGRPRHRRRCRPRSPSRWAGGSRDALVGEERRRARPRGAGGPHQRLRLLHGDAARSTTSAATRAASPCSAGARARAGSTSASDALAALLDGVAGGGRAGAAAAGLRQPRTRRRWTRRPTPAQVVAQPAAQVRRHGRAAFQLARRRPRRGRAARADASSSLQRLDGGALATVGTDDSECDTTALGDDGVWTETWQFGDLRPARHLPLPRDRGGGQGRRARPLRGHLRAVRAAAHAAARPGAPRWSRAARRASPPPTRTPASDACWRCRAGCAPGAATLTVNGSPRCRRRSTASGCASGPPVPPGAQVSVDRRRRRLRQHRSVVRLPAAILRRSPMGKTLVIAEKPSVARDLAGALPGSFKQSKDKTHLVGDDYVITLGDRPPGRAWPSPTRTTRS